MHAPLRPRCGSGGVDDDERLVRAGWAAELLSGAVVIGIGLQCLQGEHVDVGVR